MNLQRHYFLLSYFKTLNVGPAGGRAWPQHCWKTCAIRSNIAAPRYDDQRRLRANGRNIFGQQLLNCWELHVASVCTPYCMLLGVLAQSLKLVKRSFVQPKRGATMLDLFAQLFQHCWGYARTLHMVSMEIATH